MSNSLHVRCTKTSTPQVSSPVLVNGRCFIVSFFCRWTLLCLAWIAFVLSYVSVTHCSFMRKGDASLEYKSLEQQGFFSVGMYDPNNHEFLGCINYDSRYEFGGSFKFARASAVLLLLSLSVLTIGHTLSVYFLVGPRLKMIVLWICRILSFASLLFNTLLFVVFGSQECNGEDMKCPPGPGAIVSMLNELAILCMAVLFLLVPPPENPVFVRYSAMVMQRNQRPFHNGTTFSVPETVKAKDSFKKKVDKASKKKKPTNKKKPDNPSKETALVVHNGGDNVDDNGDDSETQGIFGASSSTLILDEFPDEEIPIFEDDPDDESAGPPPRRTSSMYCAPSPSYKA